MNLFVVSSSSDYKVAIVDMDSPNYDVSYVMLKDVPYEGRRYSRQVEWAEGTQYVWIGGRQDDEAYVIDIESKTLVRTFTEIDPRKLLSVAPHHFMGMADEYQTYWSENGRTKSSSAMSAQGGSNDALSIVALALSCIAIAAVTASFFAKNNAPAAVPQESAAPLTKSKIDDPSLAVPPSVA
mmetsp:Transcript_17039/g.35021  ORF Transcript_17039/g.35021 Transcript_17039/m.35021 type:complete len:182 (+) Transcript_17039:1275-1820(+)